MILKNIFSVSKPIIGMIHLDPLPGSPLYNPNTRMTSVLEKAFRDTECLEKAGVDGLQIENIWDFPYAKGQSIGIETIAALSAAAQAIKERSDLPIGINCHLNGAEISLAVAIATEAKWIRVFEYVNAYISRAGLLEGVGGRVSRMRNYLGANNQVRMMCDIQVKHGSHFIVSDKSIEVLANDAVSEGAEMLIITGFETGKPPTVEEVKTIKSCISVPVLLGSGLTSENVQELLTYADGAIVGSAFKEDNNWKNPVSYEKASFFMAEVDQLREAEASK